MHASEGLWQSLEGGGLRGIGGCRPLQGFQQIQVQVQILQRGIQAGSRGRAGPGLQGGVGLLPGCQLPEGGVGDVGGVPEQGVGALRAQGRGGCQLSEGLLLGGWASVGRAVQAAVRLGEVGQHVQEGIWGQGAG